MRTGRRQSGASTGRRKAPWSAALAVVIGVTSGCAAKGNVTRELVVYPPPPDTARIQYLTSITTELDIGTGGASFVDKLVGTKKEVKSILRPYGLAFAGGTLYVCDQMVPGVDVIDLRGRTFEFFRPPEPNEIRRPANCFVDSDSLLYVTDAARREVLVFDAQRQFVDAFGDEDNGAPLDVHVLDDRIYVSHLGGGKGVRVYDRRTREFLFHFPDVDGTDSIGLVTPQHLTIEGGQVYVSDLFKQRVLVYTTDGEYVRTVGRPGEGPATFQRPKGVAVDRDGLVYVADAAFENVQVFSPDGRLLMFFGGGGNQPGGMVLPAEVIIDYEHRGLFREYVHEGFALQYLILVVNQFGVNRITVYGFVGAKDFTTGAPPGDR